MNKAQKKASDIVKKINEFEQKAIDNHSFFDIEGLIKSFDIELDMEARLDKEISGQIEKIGDNKYKISANRNESLNRKRFTIAHELGHYIFHKSLLGEGVDDNKAYRSENVGKFHNQAIGQLEETEANQFAASVIMPFKLIKSLVAKYREDNVPESNIFSTVAKTLRVSEQAFSYRVQKINEYL